MSFILPMATRIPIQSAKKPYATFLFFSFSFFFYFSALLSLLFSSLLFIFFLFFSFFNFCGFSIGRNQYWAGRVYDLCVYYMTGTPEGSTESGFMERPGIEPATPGLQVIALIHYTTGATFPCNLVCFT